jgi:hypothetical protein
MASLSTVPVYPPPKKPVKVAIALTQAGSNYVRMWCTQAPQGSSLRKSIDGTSDPRSRFEVYKGDGGESQPWTTTFEVGGCYTFVAQEYTLGRASYGGGYQGSPDGDPLETKVGSESTLSLYIGQRFELPIAVAGDSVTLVWWIWNDTVRATTIKVHGEETPALQRPNGPRALAAVEIAVTSGVLVNRAGAGDSALIGVPSTILGNAAGGLIKEYNDHLAQATVHAANDTDNDIPTGLATAHSSRNFAGAVNEFLRKLRQHFINDAVEAGTVAGRDTAGYHAPGGTKANDNANLPLFTSVDEGSAYIALADIHRCLTAHFASTAVHNNADVVNTLTALPYALAVASAVFTVWSSTTPTVASTQSPLAVAALAKMGAKEVPL